MTDLLLWSLFWPFIIIVPLALMALFKYFNPRSFEILMYFLHRLKSEQSARQYWEDLQYLKNQKKIEKDYFRQVVQASLDSFHKIKIHFLSSNEAID